jgi:hypothetical protein
MLYQHWTQESGHKVTAKPLQDVVLHGIQNSIYKALQVKKKTASISRYKSSKVQHSPLQYIYQ